MRKLYLGVALLACIQQPVHAQLLHTQGVFNQLNTVNRQLDATTEQLRRQAERDLQLKQTTDNLANTTNRLLKLPKQLPILNSEGKTAFVDVVVENGWRAVQQEWLVMLDENEFASLQQLPVTIVEKTRFAELDMTLVRFQVPAELDSLAALKKQLPASLAARIDRNHIYSAQTASTTSAERSSTTSVCQDAVKIGMIDTAIKLDHPAFKAENPANSIVTKNFLEEKITEPEAHGTAVAGLLMGKGDELKPLLPNAHLYAASAFYTRNEYAQGATMINLVRALNWLSAENVNVINMSLAGPDNQILSAVIAKLISNGKAIVAAAGNEGPAAPAVYPAAYPGVIAVTAVDRKQKIYRWANRGDYIYFAAPGVSVLTALSNGGIGRESGTSMAAPVVSAFLSCELQKNDMATALKNLQARAIDLGEPGRDAIFGYGLLQ